jgi:hypothetical protein
MCMLCSGVARVGAYGWVTLSMEKRACKRSLNCYGKSNVDVINKNSTFPTILQLGL